MYLYVSICIYMYLYVPFFFCFKKENVSICIYMYPDPRRRAEGGYDTTARQINKRSCSIDTYRYNIDTI